MSYAVHIVRIDSQSPERREPIPLDEWLAYAASDPEMRLVGEAVFKSPKGEEIRFNAPGLTEWIDPADGSHAMFDHSRGRISTGNPTQATLVKMFQIAQKLTATVRGDDGEHYDEMGTLATRS